MWPMFIVPVPIGIQAVLDVSTGHRHQHQPPPEFEGAEEAFHLAVEEGRSYAPSHLGDSLAFQVTLEPFAELRAVVGDEEAWRVAVFGGKANQPCRIAGARCPGIDLNCQQFPREAIGCITKSAARRRLLRMEGFVVACARNLPCVGVAEGPR